MIVKKLTIFFALAMYSMFSYGQTATNTMAQSMGYYDFVRNLRNKSTDHLRVVEATLNENTAALEAQRRPQLAEEREENYRAAFNSLESEFDDIFTAFDQRLVVGGQYLDDNNAPDIDKQLLIQTNRKGLEAEIDRVIKESAQQFLS